MPTDEIDVAVVGAGQAGLATSHELTGAGVAHVVLERSDAAGGAWAGRWDSFCLVTPNHAIRLPGGEYEGDDPHGFLPRDEIVRHLRAYAASFDAPVRTGVEVRSLRGLPEGGLVLETDGGGGRSEIRARAVVVATGAFQEAHRPAWTADVPDWLPVLDAADYRNPAALAPGAVVIVGSGQTGCQLAEELALAGRRVVLACGRAAWMPRRIGDRDTFDWFVTTPFMSQTLADLPSPAARLIANPQATGARGGHDLSLRTLAALGVELAGHLVGITDDGAALFADDLAASVAFGDARYDDLRAGIEGWCSAHDVPSPEMPDPAPFAPTGLDRLALREVGSIVITCGYRPGYRAWIDHTDAFDDVGFPLQVDGVSTVVPGLFFVGVHFLRTRKSSLLLGVGDDATVVARGVAERLAPA